MTATAETDATAGPERAASIGAGARRPGTTIGSGWGQRLAGQGVGIIFRKELADHLNSPRFLILFALVAVTCLASVYVASRTIGSALTQAQIGESRFVFLALFTTGSGSLPPFTAFLSFLGPLVGLAFGFDAINAERNRGTLSRLLAQPIHRDAVINGKFLAGAAVVALMTLTLGGIVAGLGILLTGIPPTAEEIARVIVFLLFAVVYIAFWLALSLLFSVLFQQAATSALAGIAAWLFLSIFMPLLANLAADAAYPGAEGGPASLQLAHERLRLLVARSSPSTLFGEATLTLLNPTVRFLGPILLSQFEGAVPGPLSLDQSLLLVWPHLTGLLAAVLVCFAVAYVAFMRQEVRAL